MPVLTVPRRIFLYWLLLLVPALGVGTGAILLLRREQAWLEQRNSMAETARREAVAGRARLVVENIELLLGDVQNGLFEALGSEGGPATDAFLDQLEKSNPLVQTAFRAAPDGRILRPAFQTSDEKARGFLKWFGEQYGSRAPWVVPALAKGAAQRDADKREQDRAATEPPARQDVSRNVATWQSARREVQELFKSQNILNAPAAPPAESGGAKVAVLDAVNEAQPAAQRQRSADTLGMSARVPASASAARASAPPAVAAEGKSAPVPTQGSLAQAKDVVPDRRGWVPTMVEGRLNLIAWVQPGGMGEVRGVEINAEALLARLAEALPSVMSTEEAYSLRPARRADQAGAAGIFHSPGGGATAGAPAVSVPLSASLLPGWKVEGYFKPAWEPTTMRSASFFWLSTLFVIILVAAIAMGGGLLAWQARRSEQEAVQKTSFVANVSHEFKTPLTTIRLYAELLEQGRVRDAAQGGEYLRTIGRETQRLARLVNNALDFSRLEQGRKKYAREEIDLAAELGRLLDTHAPRLAEAGMTLRRELPADAVKLTTDRDALEQIVLNLIDNACKYAADGGEVTVAVVAGANGAHSTGSGQGAAVRVADRGPGVPAEHRDRIFEKFHRVDDALTAEKTGTGLGLSIARQLARGLGGDLHYVPRAGGGAEFILELP